MEFIKHKLGILVLLLCLGIVIAAIWYCIFGLPAKNAVPDGTLVEQYEEVRMMTHL